jgi:hypothetical protein
VVSKSLAAKVDFRLLDDGTPGQISVSSFFVANLSDLFIFADFGFFVARG